MEKPYTHTTWRVRAGIFRCLSLGRHPSGYDYYLAQIVSDP
jgi:hypothetical protein